MYGNEGEKWVMTKKLSLTGLIFNAVGTEFEIKPYYSVPHGYVSIQYEGVLLFIPEKIFVEHFVKLETYKQYYRLGDVIKINAGGNLSEYVIEKFSGNGDYVTMELEQNLRFGGQKS